MELVKKMNIKDLGIQIALQCAPVIAGLKMSNLLTIKNSDIRKVQKVLSASGLSYFIMISETSFTSIILFDRKKLESYLESEPVRLFLHTLGYEDFSLGNVLMTFRKRYREHMNEGSVFPHEMGILLGYPLADVKGFIRNHGRNALYGGYWKVYENVEQKKQLFSLFDSERDAMIHMLSDGNDIVDIFSVYLVRRGMGSKLPVRHGTKRHGIRNEAALAG